MMTKLKAVNCKYIVREQHNELLVTMSIVWQVHIKIWQVDMIICQLLVELYPPEEHEENPLYKFKLGTESNCNKIK